MRRNKKIVLVIALITVLLVAYFAPRGASANASTPITYNVTSVRVDVKANNDILENNYNTNRSGFPTAVTNAINNTNNLTNYSYDTSGVSQLLVNEMYKGFKFYPRVNNFAASPDGTEPGTLNYQIICLTTDTLIENIKLNVTLPAVGTKIEDYSVVPTVTAAEGEHYSVTDALFVNNYPSVDPNYDDGSIYGTTIQNGKDYYVEIFIAPEDGYSFTLDEAVEGGIPCTVNGGNDFEKGSNNEMLSAKQYAIFAKVRAEGEEPVENNSEPEEDKSEPVKPKNYSFISGEGRRFNVNYDSGLEFEIDADYSLFEDGGTVFIDNEETGKKNYKAKSGSTIITFVDDYVRMLEEGEHTLKVAFNDGGTATAKFYISKSNAPKAGDDVLVYVGVALVSILGCASIIVKRK